MAQYRKKPVVIEARQFDGTRSCGISLIHWMAEYGADANLTYSRSSQIAVVAIPTLEGTITASPGDFIIKGVQGEFYPCKADIFAATYEAV